MRCAFEAAIHEGGNGSDCRDPFDLLDGWRKRRPVIRVLMHRINGDHPVRSRGRHNRHLATELIRLMRFALGETFNFRGMDAVELVAVMALLLVDAARLSPAGV